MTIPGNLLTTAMAVMPHKDPNRALDAALSLDIPFWPQLPRMNYYEDRKTSMLWKGVLLVCGKFSVKRVLTEIFCCQKV